MPMPRNKRRRTGCLSCRQRRVKCDERKPSCERCEAANIVCAGYPQMRHVEPEPRKRRQEALSSVTERPIPGHCGHVDSSSPVPLPSNPRPDQNPGSGARHVLGYHYFLSRTLPLLFPLEHVYFWRDVLCQEAWGSEYVHLTLTSLGNLHRAVTLMTAREENVQQSGLNEKLSAVQQYTHALQELANHLDDAKRIPEILVGILCLMAYFEVSSKSPCSATQIATLLTALQSFSGNLPACVGHLRVATYYTQILTFPHDATYDGPGSIQHAPLDNCLQSLSQICRMALPSLVPSIFPSGLLSQNRPTPPVYMSAALAGAPLQELLTMTHTNEDIEQLIWNPVAAYDLRVSAEDIHGFQERLLDWETRHRNLLADLNVVSGTDGSLGSDWQTFPLPPIACPGVSLHAKLAAAHYNFYMARMKWALCVLNESPKENEMSAYLHSYQAMRCTVTQSEQQLDDATNLGDTYCVPEGLKVGFLPLLHMIGLCCPQPSWLHWIRNTCGLLQQEGIFKGHTFSTNLDCFHAFDLHSRRTSQSISDNFPPPASRVMCQLIPEPDGRHYVSYFARFRFDDNPVAVRPKRYSILGHARWRCYQGEHPCNPDLHMYGEEICVDDWSGWLASRPAAVAWRKWAIHTEFDMEHALRDHINGARLLSSSEDVHGVLR
jgi:hypothetical protein